MLKLFQVCFYTGVFFTVASFILSHISDVTHIGGHVDIGGHADIGGNADIGGHPDVTFDAHPDSSIEIHAGGTHGFVVSPLKPIVLASFVTVFGGIGMICLEKGMLAAVAAAIAAASGFVTSWALYRFVVVPLYLAQNTSAVSQAELVGDIAKTTLGIKGNSFGRISYTVNGNTYTAPAKSASGEDIKKGVNVVIIEIRKNIFYVREIKGGI